MTSTLENLSAEMADVITCARQSLIHVRSGDGGAVAGSIWHPHGLIVTNAHVVAYDNGLDLAALVVEAEDLPTIGLGDSRRLRPGELVLAMGHPWGVPGAVTAGAVIEIGPYTLEKSPWEREWIVAGLRLRPGHSGGPMMDVEGRLVGINTMITGPEVAAVVPVHVVKTFLHDKLETEKANLVA